MLIAAAVVVAVVVVVVAMPAVAAVVPPQPPWHPHLSQRPLRAQSAPATHRGLNVVMHPLCFLESFCRKCNVFGHHLPHCGAPASPTCRPADSSRILHMPHLPCTRADPVTHTGTSRSPAASDNMYDVLDADVGEDDPALDDLDLSPLDPCDPIRDGTATLAMDTLNTCGSTTLALTNSDMFAASSNSAYLDSGTHSPRSCNRQPP
jgi:hypothetical protein